MFQKFVFLKSTKRFYKICPNPHTIDAIEWIDNYFTGNSKLGFEFAIDLQGTSFQKQVWKELCKIKYGTVASYLDISERIGNPKAIRAVGAANGQNPIALAIPCHRVIGSDGSLTGYAGGMEERNGSYNMKAIRNMGMNNLVCSNYPKKFWKNPFLESEPESLFFSSSCPTNAFSMSKFSINGVNV